MKEFCCDKFEEIVEMGAIELDGWWVFWGSTAIDIEPIPLTYCPFCGAKLDPDPLEVK